ncbi:MAG: transcription-repair coupling factor [Gammaproteobacteria bacterium]|nr:transcription-repair coupling factor [Gammaproteobacteria bacterium]
MTTHALLTPPNPNKTRWGQLHGSSLSIALAEWCNTTKNKTKLLIAPNHLSAITLRDNLQFLLQQDTNTPNIVLFPDWETLPYDQFSPHQDIISDRLYALNQLQQGSEPVILIAAASTLMHRLCPPAFLSQHALVLKTDQSFQLEPFRAHLINAGYRSVSSVLEHGEFSVRGGILDLFPMGSRVPFRIERFDDTVESIRSFDPETQRTVKKLKEICILPARECPLNEASISRFRHVFREHFSGNPSLCPVYDAVSQGKFPQGIEYYLPLFFEKTATLFNYLPETAQICLIESVKTHAEEFWKEINNRYQDRKLDPTRPALTPETNFLNPIELLTLSKTFNPLRMQQAPETSQAHATNFKTEKGPKLPVMRQAEKPLKNLLDYLKTSSYRTLFMVESTGRREALLDLLKSEKIHPTIHSSFSAFLQSTDTLNLMIGPLTEGVVLPEAKLSILVESQLFGEQATPQQRARDKKAVDPDTMIRDLTELRIGAPLVHLEFGVGRYLGLQLIENQDIQSEFIILNYANDDKIYVPVTALHMLSRYTGADSDHAPLHRLGSDQWSKERKKAAEKIHDVAVQLLEVHAKRAASKGHAHQCARDEYNTFVSGFPFEETLDQTNAIRDITEDMKSDNPMDRLICGDVGFGKTEVAMRAAFIAIQSGKQVCVLAPTTLLAGQHFETFRDRFSEFPITLDLLSRFKTPKEAASTIEKLKQGRLDLVIGTHKLLQKGIEFDDLGLLIIDEEHRFGVKQKEKIKSLRTHVDILSMTATPIPRTLNMAMAGIRDISLIATPPAKRLAIKTFWQEKNNTLVREAVLREILRGGQVFFLHNNVQTITRISEELQKLVPEASVQIAHGQMRERELERVMSDFYHQKFNVLVCTTIIETGIDIPTANTILIDKADHFGLAQLHQLRGRVGRSHHQAYAYLLTPKDTLITKDAKKRLEVITSIEDLGAGFILATHDLEIRGAGELLGEEQSGNMHAIGFSLYMEMLEEAVEALKSGKIPELNAKTAPGPEIELGISAIIPEDYVGDVHTRLTLYKRIAHAKSTENLHELQVELIDRFGLLPAPVKNLFSITHLKHFAERLGVKRISASKETTRIEFTEAPHINTAKLIQLIQTNPKQYQLNGANRLKFISEEVQTGQARIKAIETLLKTLV